MMIKNEKHITHDVEEIDSITRTYVFMAELECIKQTHSFVRHIVKNCMVISISTDDTIIISNISLANIDFL